MEYPTEVEIEKVAGEQSTAQRAKSIKRLILQARIAENEAEDLLNDKEYKEYMDDLKAQKARLE